MNRLFKVGLSVFFSLILGFGLLTLIFFVFMPSVNVASGSKNATEQLAITTFDKFRQLLFLEMRT